MTDVERVALDHARRVAAGDRSAAADLASDARLTPADLLDRLLAQRFSAVELVGHARIGAQHVFKTKYVGSAASTPGPTVVVQARWAQGAGGSWRLLEAEVARLEGHLGAG
jgi:hypothetical protein